MHWFASQPWPDVTATLDNSDKQRCVSDLISDFAKVPIGANSCTSCMWLIQYSHDIFFFFSVQLASSFTPTCSPIPTRRSVLPTPGLPAIVFFNICITHDLLSLPIRSLPVNPSVLEQTRTGLLNEGSLSANNALVPRSATNIYPSLSAGFDGARLTAQLDS